jgi:DNA-binding LytR/AlgR family response regulator
MQSFGNYVKVYTQSKFYLASTTTHELLSQLSVKIFLRIHKSYIINLEKIAKRSDNEVFINGSVIPVGITYKRYLAAKLIIY